MNEEYNCKKYECDTCIQYKFENVTPISFICKCCSVKTCATCVETENIYDEERGFCNMCVMLFTTLNYSEILLGRELSDDEEEEICLLYDNMYFHEDINEFLSVLEIMKELYIERDGEPELFSFNVLIVEYEHIIQSILDQANNRIDQEVDF